MEDVLHFIECYSFHVFRGDVLPAPYKEMWRLLRAACVHYLRAVKAADTAHPYTLETREAARANLLEYSILVEKVSR